MSHDEKKTIEATKKPEDSKEELSEAELDKVAGGASVGRTAETAAVVKGCPTEA
jgi:hypothetical protein